MLAAAAGGVDEVVGEAFGFEGCGGPEAAGSTP
jgi:hypothetical protein